MTIHWIALEEHFLMVPLVFQFTHFWGMLCVNQCLLSSTIIQLIVRAGTAPRFNKKGIHSSNLCPMQFDRPNDKMFTFPGRQNTDCSVTSFSTNASHVFKPGKCSNSIPIWNIQQSWIKIKERRGRMVRMLDSQPESWVRIPVKARHGMWAGYLKIHSSR
jgi:hypothetical protein